MFLTKNTQVIGLDIGSHSIKVAQLKKKKGSFELMNFGIMPISPEFIVDGMIENVEGVAEAVKRLLLCEKIKTKHAVVSVSGESVVIKKISAPEATEEELLESDSIKTEAERYIPFDIDECNVDFQILPRDAGRGEASAGGEGPQMDVIIAATKKETVESRLEVLTAAGLRPMIVDLDVFAVENCYEINEEFDPAGVTALVNLGASTTNINILEGGVTAFVRDVPIGSNAFNQAIMKQLGVGPDAAEQLKLGLEVEGKTQRHVGPIVVNSVNDITQEIFKSFEFFSTARNKDVDHVFLCGGGAMMPGLDKKIAEKIGVKKTELFNPFSNIKVNDKYFDPEYLDMVGPQATVSIGLASRRHNDRT